MRIMNFQATTLCFLFVLFLSTQINGNQSKRRIAICPPHFFPIFETNQCYYISQDRVNWLDAHFECKDRFSRLAEPLRKEDRFLRKYLNHLNGNRPDDTWIGARFNWEQNKWQWGYEGKDLTYQSFSQMSAENKDLKFHCAILKPGLRYRWSASSCVQQHQYICQHNIRYATDRNRQEIYKKWNETYPNEKANEFEHELTRDDLLRFRRKKSRSHPKFGMNNRHIKKDQNSRRNEIQANVIQRNQLQNPHRKMRKENRLKNHKQFDLNRKRADGIRQPIDFGRGKPNRTYDRGWRHRQRVSNTTFNPNYRKIPIRTTTATTTTTTTTTTSTTSAPTTTTTTTPAMTRTTAFRPAIWTSNDVNQYDDRYAEESKRRELEKQQDLRRREQEINRRLYEDEINRKLEKENRKRYQNEQNRRYELNEQRDEEVSNWHAIQTNEILDNTIVTTTPMNRRDRQKKLHDRLKKLPIEKQHEFLKRRAERNRKRGIRSENITNSSHSK